MRPATSQDPCRPGRPRRRAGAALSLTLSLALLLLAGAAGSPRPAGGATMDTYCQYPPYVFQSTLPSVNLVVSNSSTMLNFEYYDGWDNAAATPNLCDSTAARCYQFDPAKRYYGYFNSLYYYSYSASKWRRQGLVSAGKPNASYWNGNFLNWLTMRRVDALRKVLTGGTMQSQEACVASQGLYKAFMDNQLYTGFNTAGTWYRVNFSTGCSGSAASTMTVQNSTGTALASYLVAINETAPEGIVQSIQGTKANLALTFFNSDAEGGGLTPEFGGPNPISSLVNRVNTPSNFNNIGDGPLGETLWTAFGDFAQVASVSGLGTCAVANCGPRYHNGDYSTTTLLNDPYNYAVGNHLSTCIKGYVVILSDGEPRGDGHIPSTVRDYADSRSYSCNGCDCPAGDNTFSATTVPGCTTATADSFRGLEDVALYAHTMDHRSSSFGKSDIAGTQKLDTYVIRAFGRGQSNLLKYTAINGTFDDLNGNGQADPGEYQLSSAYFEAEDGYELASVVSSLFQQLLRRATSGTAASVLASGEGSGANLIQAVFYPRRRFGEDLVTWTGSLQNMWYYVDPYFSNASIREDTDLNDKLKLDADMAVVFYFDEVSQTTKAKLFGSDVDGTLDNTYSYILPLESTRYLWEAGSLLSYRDPATRVIYTDNGTHRVDFTTANAAALSPWLLPGGTGPTAANIIQYVRGVDDQNADNVADYRSRTRLVGTSPYVWKLGDIVNSTPKLAAGTPLNTYYQNFGDTTYRDYTLDNAYRDRGTVFVGGNDGMLHAFKLGRPTFTWTGQLDGEKAWLQNLDASTPLGHEMWSFIPRNALPYLQYMLDNNYCHIYTVDLPPTLVDASIGGTSATDNIASSHWRTVLVGGMRYGGGCANTCAAGADCVPNPSANVGYSSYFALDVTDPANPVFLWEFSNANLGFSTTGPAIVRVNPRDGTTGDVLRNRAGHWYAVFGSGPTGPIDNTYRQFLGRSNQNLRLFVVDLETGSLVRTIDTGIANAFAGSMANSTADYNVDYEDDAVYFGYTKRASDGTYTQGGVGRLVLKNGPSVNDWAFSRVIDDVGPVTSAVARLQNVNYGTAWLFFGTGRYFFETPGVHDDPTNQRRLFGVREPSTCFPYVGLGSLKPTLNPDCSSTVSYASLVDVTSNTNYSEATANGASFPGWRIDLDTASTANYDNVSRYYRAERVITDPLATTQGLVFFTTFRPYSDDCALGGKSFLWAVRYNTGGAPAQALLLGKAMMQVSTASVEQVDLSTAFRPASGEALSGLHRGGRRSGSMEGVPPTAQGLSILSPPPPVKRLIHMKER